MTRSLSAEDEFERVSVTFKNGFKHPKEYNGSGQKFVSNEDLEAVWITVGGRGVLHVAAVD